MAFSDVKAVSHERKQKLYEECAIRLEGISPGKRSSLTAVFPASCPVVARIDNPLPFPRLEIFNRKGPIFMVEYWRSQSAQMCWLPKVASCSSVQSRYTSNVLAAAAQRMRISARQVDIVEIGARESPATATFTAGFVHAALVLLVTLSECTLQRSSQSCMHNDSIPSVLQGSSRRLRPESRETKSAVILADAPASTSMLPVPAVLTE